MSELESQVVYHNLKWEWSWRGMTMAHLYGCAIPAGLYLFVATWLDELLPKSFVFPILLASFVALFVLQYRQTTPWFWRWLNNAGLPHFLAHRWHIDQRPFPVSREALACLKK